MIGRSGKRSFSAFEIGTALTSCGPGMTVSAIAVTGSPLARCFSILPETVPTTSMLGRLPSMISQLISGGSPAPIAISDNGNRRLSGRVARGLMRRIMAAQRSKCRTATASVSAPVQQRAGATHRRAGTAPCGASTRDWGPLPAAASELGTR